MENKKSLQALMNHKPNTILLQESKCSFAMNFVKDYCKSINCNNSKTYCNVCLNCKKIDDSKYFDLIIFDFYENNVHKEDLLKTLNKAKYGSLEDAGNKFIIFKGIENANKFITNLLLTTIEKEHEKTYYIFLTRNIHAVLPTIKSRCSCFKLYSDLEKTKEFLKYHQIDLKYFAFFINAFYEIDDMKNFYESKDFEKILTFVDKLINSKNKFNEYKNLLTTFKTFDYCLIEKLIYLLIESFKDKQQMFNILKNLNLNINKTLIFNEILDAIF